MGWCLVAWLPGGSQPGGRVRSALFLLPTGNAERGRRGSAGGPRGIAHQRPSSRKDVVYGHGGGGSTIGLNGLRGLFQSQRICDSVTLWEAQRAEWVKLGGALSVLQH